MQSMLQDFGFACRALSRHRTFVAAVIITLALGIGANTAVFTLIDAVLLRPVAIEHPEEVVAVFKAVNAKTPNGGVAFPFFAAMRDQSRTLSGIAAHSSHSVSVVAQSGPEQVVAAAVTGNYFSLLGVRPALGRMFVPVDDAGPLSPSIIVISYRTWERFFNADPAVIGKTLRIGELPFTVIGVAPSSFRGTELADVADLWAPLSTVTTLGIGGLFAPRMADQIFVTPAFSWLDLVARVRPGADPRIVTAELNQINGTVEQRFPEKQSEMPTIKAPMSIMPVAQSAALRDRDSLLRFIRLMLGVVAATLLLACANVANLLLARGSERAHELGVRAALGAGRARIATQLFMESILLALSGAVVGLIVAVGMTRALSPYTLPGAIAVGELNLNPDGRVLAFTAGVALLTSILFGLMPSLAGSRPGLTSFLRMNRGSSGGGRIRNSLISAQVALALMLLIGAALFGRSLRAGLTSDIGFDPTRLAAVTADLRIHGYDTPRQLAYHHAAVDRLRGRPGIQGVALATHVPLAKVTRLPFESPDSPPDKAAKTLLAVNAVSEDFFSVLGLAAVSGRLFDRTESSGNSQVAIVNTAAARAMWGDASAIGKRLTMFGRMQYTVIGTVATTKYQSVRDEDVPALYFPLAQEPSLGAVSVIVKSATPAAGLRTLQRELAAIDPAVSLRRPRLVGEQIADVLMPQRFGATLLAGFSLIALVIAAVGVYGVVTYAVSQRRRELGIRIALGAQWGHIYWTVLRTSLAAVTVGTIIGIAGAMAGSPALSAFLFGISTLDAVAFVAAAGVLLFVAVGAAVVPARRAARTDPAISMRATDLDG